MRTDKPAGITLGRFVIMCLQDPGIGVCRIVGIAASSPALECRQIRVGDCIISVDGTSVSGMSARQVAAMLSGAEGTLVAVELEVRALLVWPRKYLVRTFGS